VSYEANADADGAGNPFQSNGFQLHAHDPMPGAWTFTLQIVEPVTGNEVSQGFHASLVFDSVKISADLPSSASTRLAAGVPVVVPVKITNTGPVPQTYFTDARLDRTGDMVLADLLGLPQPIDMPNGPNPIYILPPEMTNLVFTADGTVPVTSVVQYSSGNPELAADGHMPAVITTTAKNLSAGFWFTDITSQGPFDPVAPAGTMTVTAVAHGKLFDPAVTSTTGDAWPAFIASSFDAAAAQRTWATHQALVGAFTSGSHPTPAAPASPPEPTGPVTVAPGATVTVYVTITPSAPVGTVVHGHLYVDTFGAFTGGGDELIDLPYAYKVK